MFSAEDGTMASFMWCIYIVWLSCLRVDIITDGGWMCQGVTSNCNY